MVTATECHTKACVLGKPEAYAAVWRRSKSIWRFGLFFISGFQALTLTVAALLLGFPGLLEDLVFVGLHFLRFVLRRSVMVLATPCIANLGTSGINQQEWCSGVLTAAVGYRGVHQWGTPNLDTTIHNPSSKTCAASISNTPDVRWVPCPLLLHLCSCEKKGGFSHKATRNFRSSGKVWGDGGLAGVRPCSRRTALRT